MIEDSDSMKNDKGQALIEFVLILPVILLILLYIVEFGRIILKKYELENNLDIVTTLYLENKTEDLIVYIVSNDIEISYKTSNGLMTIEISKSLNSNMPLINKILGNSIKTQRTIYEVQQ